jgi:hypothetical protein
MRYVLNEVAYIHTDVLQLIFGYISFKIICYRCNTNALLTAILRIYVHCNAILVLLIILQYLGIIILSITGDPFDTAYMTFQKFHLHQSSSA